MVVSIVAILVMTRDAYEREIRLERCSGCCCHWTREIITAYWRSSYQVYTSTQEVSYKRWIESKHDDVSMKDSLEGWRPKGGRFQIKSWNVPSSGQRDTFFPNIIMYFLFFDVLAADWHFSTDRRRPCYQHQEAELSTVRWMKGDKIVVFIIWTSSRVTRPTPWIAVR